LSDAPHHLPGFVLAETLSASNFIAGNADNAGLTAKTQRLRRNPMKDNTHFRSFVRLHPFD
jgi:hypothetical protein